MEALKAPESVRIIPGQGGVRVPLPRYVQPDGEWGYTIPAAHPGNGHSHHLVNFVGFPRSMEIRETEKSISDMRCLMESNHRANYATLRLQKLDGYKCWSELWGRNEGEILVIASCGPSLTHSLPVIYRHRKRFRLMTLNRSHRAFQDPAARPDYHYFVERRALVDWCHEMEDESGRAIADLSMDGVTMIGTPQCDPRVVNLFRPDLRYWGWSSLGGLGDMAEAAALKSFDVKAGTTIGNAPYIAWKLGFRKIVLVGCDFSLDVRMVTEAGRMHVEPTRMYFDRIWQHTHYAGDPDRGHKDFLARHFPLLGIDGLAAVADARLIGWAQYFMAVLDIVQYEAGVEVVNASPRGLLDWNPRTFEEAIEC